MSDSEPTPNPRLSDHLPEDTDPTPPDHPLAQLLRGNAQLAAAMQQGLRAAADRLDDPGLAERIREIADGTRDPRSLLQDESFGSVVTRGVEEYRERVAAETDEEREAREAAIEANAEELRRSGFDLPEVSPDDLRRPPGEGTAT